MLASSEYIPLVTKMGQLELFRNFKVGAHLIRGYADLGNEEFILVGPGKLISLYTGTPSTLPEGHEHFFYRVPSIDEITDSILRKNFDIKQVSYKDQRLWILSAEQIESKEVLVAQHAEFECAVATLLIAIVEFGNAKHV